VIYSAICFADAGTYFAIISWELFGQFLALRVYNQQMGYRWCHLYVCGLRRTTVTVAALCDTTGHGKGRVTGWELRRRREKDVQDWVGGRDHTHRSRRWQTSHS